MAKRKMTKHYTEN